MSVLLLCNGKCELESTRCRRRRALQVCKLLAGLVSGLRMAWCCVRHRMDANIGSTRNRR